MGAEDSKSLVCLCEIIMSVSAATRLFSFCVWFPTFGVYAEGFALCLVSLFWCFVYEVWTECFFTFCFLHESREVTLACLVVWFLWPLLRVLVSVSEWVLSCEKGGEHFLFFLFLILSVVSYVSVLSSCWFCIHHLFFSF